MRTIVVWCVLLIVLSGSVHAQQAPADFPKLTGPYLGQKAPGMTPEIFAPGIVSTENHEFSCSFTPDGSELYFTRATEETPPLVMVTKLVDGVWTRPEVVPFVENTASFEPRVTADGKRLYYTYAGKVPDSLGPPISIDAGDMYPFIAPDESYLLFCSRRPVEGIKSESFLSFRSKDGTWSEPRAVDVGQRAGLPLVTPDGKFLFFTGGERGKSDIYWVDAKILDDLRPK